MQQTPPSFKDFGLSQAIATLALLAPPLSKVLEAKGLVDSSYGKAMRELGITDDVQIWIYTGKDYTVLKNSEVGKTVREHSKTGPPPKGALLLQVTEQL